MGFLRAGALLLALLSGLLLPRAASAVPMPVNPEAEDITDCLTRTTAETVKAQDTTDGNYVARRDVFTLQNSCVGGYLETFVDGLSIIVKTPFQIDSTPDVDDIDSVADAMILFGEMESLWPDFGHWGANFVVSAGPPTIGAQGTYNSVELCVNPGSVANCLAQPPLAMMDIGGGYMIHTIDLGSFEDSIYLCGGDCSEEILSFELVTIAHSNITSLDSMGNPALPELVLGFRMVELENVVPEPGTALLLLPGLAAALALRRRS